MDLCRRYIPIDFEMELCPSVIITDGNNLSVISLVFSDFLLVMKGKTKNNIKARMNIALFCNRKNMGVGF